MDKSTLILKHAYHRQMCYRSFILADIISVSCTFAENTHLVPISFGFVITEDGRRGVLGVLSNPDNMSAMKGIVIFCVYHNIFRIHYYTSTWSKA